MIASHCLDTAIEKIYTPRDIPFPLLLLIFLFCLSDTYAATTDVTLFPSTATVRELTKIKFSPEGKDFFKAVITLPPQADPLSLIVDPLHGARLFLEDIAWHRQSFHEDAKITEIRKRINQLKNDKNILEGSRISLDAQIQFWQQQIKTKAKSLSEAGSFVSTIGKNLKKASQDKQTVASEITTLEKTLKELDELLKIKENHNQGPWKVTLLVSGAHAGEVNLSYRYMLKDCGWFPFYRINAYPQKGELDIGVRAVVWQNTGEDWKEVNLTLSNKPTSRFLSPPEVTPWIIIAQHKKKTGKQLISKKKPDLLYSNNTIISDQADTMDSSGPTPVIRWDIGKQSIPSGARRHIKVREETWSSYFTYFTRPNTAPDVFVNAYFNHADRTFLPLGTALFLLNEKLVGKESFLFNGREGNIYFGTDQDIIVTRTIEHINTDNDKVNTYHREWRITIKNTLSFPITMRLEESLPIITDDGIKMVLTHVPTPYEKSSSSLVWKFDIPAENEKTILLGMELETTTDREIDPVWR